MPGPNDYSRIHPPMTDDEHPFLTPKGYRLMRDRKRVASSVPMQFPQYPVQGEIYHSFHPPLAEGEVLLDQNGQPVHIASSVEYGGQPIHHSVPLDENGNPIQIIENAPPFSTNPTNVIEPALQNIVASKKYPDPISLGNKPLGDAYESKLVKNPLNGQLKAIGKLLISISDNPVAEPAVGSAWIAGPSLLITSAHNVYEFSSREWSRAVEFHPGFDYYSQKPLPKCRVVSCCIPKGYLKNPTTNNDIAACFVDINIGDIVGAEIPMRPVTQHDFFDRTEVTIVGYPAGSSFDFGKQMWQSRGDYLFGHRSGPGDDFAPVMATNFGGGSSGCPWLIRDEENGKLVSVGVTSAHAKLRYERGEPNLMSLISPYFGPRLFDSLSHNHVFHEFDTPESSKSSTNKRTRKKR